MEEHVIMEAISANPVTVICGETGSGKTTQVPQFLYEAGYGDPNSTRPGKIGVTEPRRVAAMSMASRVAEELNVPFGPGVGYQVRYDANVTPSTAIKFMTDGVLLREIQADFALSSYSAIILDEAHERGLNTDILIGLLSRIVRIRAAPEKFPKLSLPSFPLKIIIMSATLRVSDFTENAILFPVPPPVVSVDARRFPVTIHYNKRTPIGAHLAAAKKKVLKIHSSSPQGAILVFLTGEAEIIQLVNELRDAFRVAQEHGPTRVLPLYSKLPSHQQLRVFDPVPEGTRLVVLATNIAETSLTIPDVKYVVDTGLAKQRVYYQSSGMSTFEIDWVSKANADQRAGRAGRTGPGHCYRLYSSAVHGNHFPQFSPPEISRMPIDAMVLQMKSMRIDKVLNFPFPSPPPPAAVEAAIAHLKRLGALDSKTSRITQLGKTLVAFPVAPRFAKMLTMAWKPSLLPHAITLVATISVGSPFARSRIPKGDHDDEGDHDDDENEDDDSKGSTLGSGFNTSHLPFFHKDSDLFAMLKAAGGYAFEGGSREFCEKYGLVEKAMKEISALRVQLSKIANGLSEAMVTDGAVDNNVVVETRLGRIPPPSRAVFRSLAQVVTAGLIDNVAYRDPNHESYRSGGYVVTLPDTGGVMVVHIHPSSFLSLSAKAFRAQSSSSSSSSSSAGKAADALPSWVVFQELITTSKTWMKGVTAIDPEWLIPLAKPLISLGPPLETPPPVYDPKADRVKAYRRATYGPHGWPLPLVQAEHPVALEYFRYIALALLDGTMFPKTMARLAPHYTADPSFVTKPWMHTKINIILQPLLKANIISKAALQARFAQDPNFLLLAMKVWVDSSAHPTLITNWPPIR